MTTTTPPPDLELADQLNRISHAVWTMESCIGVLQAARDGKLPENYFVIEDLEALMFRTARQAAGGVFGALERLEGRYRLQGLIGVDPS